jgi:hypothetical protein
MVTFAFSYSLHVFQLSPTALDVALERAAGQEIPRDVVEPDTLAHVVKQLCSFHGFASTDLDYPRQDAGNS